MANSPKLPDQEPLFVGRKRELEEIREFLFRGYPPQVLMVIGLPGIGKTALVREALEEEFRRLTPVWFSFHDVSKDLKKFDETLHDVVARGQALEDGFPFGGRAVIILDAAEGASKEQLERLRRIIFNYKRVSGLILTSRNALPLEGRELYLRGLTSGEKQEMLRSDLEEPLSYEQLQALIEKAGDSPLGLSVVSGLLKKFPAGEVLTKLDGQVYDLKKSEESKIVQAVRPTIISFSNELILQLKKSPEELHQVNPRQFEHLVADIFHDMGWEVELTKATRDGGRDILAHLNTGLMRLLCLIEAKKYRKDRPVGVQLVRSLYGTFCDEQANGAMLVTSSYFSNDAKKFQEKHKYQLELKDYADVIGWVANYKGAGMAPKNFQ